jgi:hypothetical protein
MIFSSGAMTNRLDRLEAMGGRKAPAPPPIELWDA